MKKMMLLGALQLGLVVSLLFPVQVIAKGLILTAPPRESAEAGKKLYGPIADHLTALLGSKVVYEHPGNWIAYQRDMRNDKYDIVFDGPHFVSWRIAHLGHQVLVKLPGHLQFVLLTDKDNSKYSKADDLIGKNICGISPPNLSTLSVLDYYRNPVRQPVIKGVKGGMGKVYKSLVAGKCEAAVLRTAFHSKKLTNEQRAGMKQLFLSQKMPNQAISVSARISPQARRKIAESLTMGNGVASTSGILKRFGGKAKTFIHASNSEYQTQTALLEGVNFGW
ncbi:MAG: PhnD/SsuA/transferrin family substrate-binding protein [Gammaproteobacteria bacterium]